MNTRAFATVAGCVALLIAGYLATRGASIPVAARGAPERRPHVESTRIPASGVFAMETPAPSLATPAPRMEAVRRAPPAVPFTFAGAMKDGGETAFVLRRGTRTFTVRGAGRLDDHYEVESIQEGFLMLRHVPSGEQQVLELALPPQAPTPHNSAEETPQD